MENHDGIDNGKAYDLISDDWQRFRSKTKINRCIVELADRLDFGGNVLDIGCGTGYPIAQYLVLRGFYVTGIDISPEMINKANALRLENAVFINQDILEFTTAVRYDCVIAFDSIWHIAKHRQPDAYGKIASLMKRGAYLLFTHGNTNSETVGSMFGQRFYYGALSVNEVTVILSEVGLNVITLTEHYKEKTTGERDLLMIAQKI